MHSKQTGVGSNFTEDCRQILIMCRQMAALTSYEMARVVKMIPRDYLIAERSGKGLKTSHLIEAAKLVGLKLTIKITPLEGSDLAPMDIPLT